jgi:hypothetical protein
LSIFGPGLKIPEYVLHQDHRRIHDDAEVNGADRQQVRILSKKHQYDDAEKQRERNVGADDDGAAQIAQEYPLDQENQKATEDEIVQDGAGGDRYQRGPIIVGNQLHSGRQGSVIVYFFHFRLDAGHHIIRVIGSAHHDNGQRHIIVAVAPGNAQPRHKADRDFGDLLYLHRNAVHLREHDVLDVVHLPALGQIVCPSAVEQPDAADIHGLLADRDLASADIDVGATECPDDLGQRDVVSIELVQIDFDIVLLGGAAPRVHRDNAWNGKQPADGDPILHRAQIGQPEVRWTDHLVAKNLADQARLLDRGRHSIRKADPLLQAQRSLRIGEEIVDAPLERDADERQPIERGGADIGDPGSGIEADFHRDRVIALHLLGREAGGLGGDFQDHGRRIGVGLDIELGEGDGAAGDEDQQAQHDDRASGEPECNNSLQHGSPLYYLVRGACAGFIGCAPSSAYC